ncbi:hypothetical protein ACFXB5_36555, partial [Streptomyces sp. NPDC059455]
VPFILNRAAIIITAAATRPRGARPAHPGRPSPFSPAATPANGRVRRFHKDLLALDTLDVGYRLLMADA